MRDRQRQGKEERVMETLSKRRKTDRQADRQADRETDTGLKIQTETDSIIRNEQKLYLCC